MPRLLFAHKASGAQFPLGMNAYIAVARCPRQRLCVGSVFGVQSGEGRFQGGGRILVSHAPHDSYHQIGIARCGLGQISDPLIRLRVIRDR